MEYNLPYGVTPASVYRYTPLYSNIVRRFLPKSTETIHLLNQPDIVIKRLPLGSDGDSVYKKNVMHESIKNGVNINWHSAKGLEVAKIPKRSSNNETDEVERNEIANFLPSKTNNKKSEITLLPIKRKSCGHYESCENIVCDVVVQYYIDQGMRIPILPINIKESEINASVAKHCENKYCDALSIDHNRCRKVIIKLYKCDIFNMCDICEIILNEQKLRLYHENCTRKNKYEHNNVDSETLKRDKMRERELQILETARMRRNDYLDPVKGYDLALKTLRRNKELIITSKVAPHQKSIVTTTTTPNVQSTVAESVNVNSFVNSINLRNIVITPQLSATLPSSWGESRAQMTNQVKISFVQQNSTALSTVQSQPRINLTVPSTTVQSITLNNLIVPSSSILTTQPIQLGNMMPIRVVPITTLNTAPSLLHRTQGVPRFCIMPDNRVMSPTMPNAPPLHPMVVTNSNHAQQKQAQASTTPVQATESLQKQSKSPKKLSNLLKSFEKKIFACTYCPKRFSTDWYFKMHVAKHKGEKLYFCNLCDESFSDWYDMKKHMAKKHKTRTEFTCNACDYVGKTSASLNNHVKLKHVMPNPDKTNDNDKLTTKAQKRKKARRRISACYEEYSVNKMNKAKQRCIKLTRNLKNEVDVKKLKCENTLGGANMNEKTDNKRTEAEDFKLEKSKKELLTVKENDNKITNGIASVSVENNFNSNIKENVITFR